ncbi:6-phosphogluconate dehydrogenase [Bisporella sp. PMI_857]|nr:6-phosphogluconate dehydrogenase [Bisporella sp. PMI_857]
MAPLATVGVLSIGEMGMGISKLLIAHNYRVVTNIEGRSEDTHARAKQSKIETLSSDIAVVKAADYILSIVPPRDAVPVAHRITTAFKSLSSAKDLYYLDLNAISPRRAREIAAHFAATAPEIKFVDGGIIGPAPTPKSSAPGQDWSNPDIPVSGRFNLADAPISGAHLSETLNLNHISPEIGPASGLKCCFASTSKGFTALCIQAFTTASNLGVLPLLRDNLERRMPGIWKRAEGGVTGMPPKAYRWVREMEEIALTHTDDGGFEGGKDGEGVFGEIAKVYRSVAEDSVLGEEKTERRKRGLTIEDVAQAMGEGLRNKRKKAE